MRSIQDLLRRTLEVSASDLHLTVERPPVVRVHGKLEDLPEPVLGPEDTRALLDEILPAQLRPRFEATGDADFSCSVPGLARFRVNAYRQRGSVGLAIRVIPTRILTLDELGLPRVVADLARAPQGLILVTGPTGSGKSTTLAAIVDLLNTEYRYHIITLEDPIEFLHRHRQSIVNQREVESDTESFARGLRAALREDPDVIMVGEMRDLETIATAITAAETGHLVLASLHTASAPQTVDRIIDAFPPHQQQQIRQQLAGSLVGVVAQTLAPRVDRPGRVALLEVLVATPAVRNLIREGKTHQLPAAIETGARFGMRSFEVSRQELARQGIITGTGPPPGPGR